MRRPFESCYSPSHPKRRIWHNTGGYLVGFTLCAALCTPRATFLESGRVLPVPIPLLRHLVAFGTQRAIRSNSAPFAPLPTAAFANTVTCREEYADFEYEESNSFVKGAACRGWRLSANTFLTRNLEILLMHLDFRGVGSRGAGADELDDADCVSCLSICSFNLPVSNFGRFSPLSMRYRLKATALPQWLEMHGADWRWCSLVRVWLGLVAVVLLVCRWVEGKVSRRVRGVVCRRLAQPAR